jgi:hypothetical protein
LFELLGENNNRKGEGEKGEADDADSMEIAGSCGERKEKEKVLMALI